VKNRTHSVFLAVAAVAAALQIYFVRELLATLILIAVVFSAFALLILLLKAIYWMYAKSFAWLEARARTEIRNRPFRRLRSLTAR
jgi:hypothetical protein